jgi:hypothetical protein
VKEFVENLKRTCEIALEAFEQHGDKNNLKEYVTGRRDACISILNEVALQ